MGKNKKSKKLDKEIYETEIEKLQLELVRLQEWVKSEKQKVVVIFEGRDAAGKGGVIKRITERVSPRVFRVVALPAPNEREKSQVYLQRYMAQLPAGGEIVLFDRSWYNRGGVEKVMGFCNDEQYEEFMNNIPNFEEYIIRSGIILIKYFFNVSAKEQRKRFESRIKEPAKHWKLSPMDIEAINRWWDYSKAFKEIFKRTSTEKSPWHIVNADDKRRARLNCITHMLSQIPYERVDFDKPELPQHPKKPDDFNDLDLSSYMIPKTF